MSKPINHYPAEFRTRIVLRRLEEQTKGLGYWAAYDAAKKYGISVPKK